MVPTPRASAQALAAIQKSRRGHVCIGYSWASLINGSASGARPRRSAAARCSDGMSDRAYGLEAMLVREDEAGASLLAGCCTIGR